MAGHQPGGEDDIAQFHGVPVVDHFVDGMHFAAGGDAFHHLHILGHDDHLGARHLLQRRVALHVVAVGVVAQNDLDVAGLEAHLRDRLGYHRHVPLVGGVDQDVPLAGDDQERCQLLGADVIDVADDPVGRERGFLFRGRTHVAVEDRSRRIGDAAHGHRGMIGRRARAGDGRLGVAHARRQRRESRQEAGLQFSHRHLKNPRSGPG